MNLNLQDMLAKVQEMQTKMAETQEKLKALETTVEVGGGMIAVTINGRQEVRKVSIDKAVLESGDHAMLEDLMVAAINKAIEESQNMAKQELGKVTSGMIPNIPGLDLGNLGM